MEAVREKKVKPQQEKKKSFMNRVRKSSMKNVLKKEKESRAPTSSKVATSKSVTRDGVPVISADDDHKFKPSDVRKNKSQTVKNGKKFATKSIILEQAPAAREAAFSGPPRYDWIDIETAAAIKLQSVFRRNKVMDEMDNNGLETTAMRNRKRRGKARTRSANVANEDTPSFFQCCGAGLMFGYAGEGDEVAQRAFEREQFEFKNRDLAQQEAKKRAYKPRARADHNIRESIEIVQ